MILRGILKHPGSLGRAVGILLNVKFPQSNQDTETPEIGTTVPPPMTEENQSSRLSSSKRKPVGSNRKQGN